MAIASFWPDYLQGTLLVVSYAFAFKLERQFQDTFRIVMANDA
jgi:hypothetical protein